MAIRTMKVRMYPNREQEAVLNRTLSICCQLYNSLLEYCRNCHEFGLKHPSRYDLQNLLPDQKRIWPELKLVYAQVLQDVSLRLSRAFDGFFRRLKEGSEEPGYPRFRSWQRYDSFTYTQGGFKVFKDRIVLSPNKQTVRIRGFRRMDGKIKTCTIKRSGCAPNYRWEAVLTYEADAPRKCRTQSGTRVSGEDAERKGAVGIDMGLTTLVMTSDGKAYPNGNGFVKAEKQLSKMQRRMSRYEKGTPEREKYRQRLIHAYNKIDNKRKGKMYEIVNDLVDNYDAIIMEELDVREMAERSLSKGMSKSYRDASWGRFMFTLGYKAEEAGVQLVKVDPRYTSQLCSVCGTFVPKDLSDRRHRCGICGLDVDRD